MKKIYILFVLALFSTLGFACPICGCGGTNTYMGLFPHFQNAFMGVRYNYSHLHTTLFSDASQYSTNYYNTMEVWGGANIGSKFQVMGFIPYYLNKQIDDDGTSARSGLGDVTLIGQYKIFSNTSLTAKRKVVQQQLWLGAGVKLPTGLSHLDFSNTDITVADVNAELGTGSTDFLLNSMYNVTIKNFGINASANFKINTSNNGGYKYGNKFSSNLIAFYQVNLKKKILVPNAGLGYENVGSNFLKTSIVRYTASNVTNAITGMELNMRKVSVGVNAQVPIAQNFAEGQTRLRLKGMVHVTFTL